MRIETSRFIPALRRLTLLMSTFALLVTALPIHGAAAPTVSWSTIDRDFERLAPGHNLLVAEFVGNRCQSIHGV
ncbi:MAG: hypothetical protein M3451_11695, partial [Chloroflexota bacterium]|nr:hypothetical protein [Chloroflexota bacterium]